jgi:predicted nucleic acid-binding protein
MYRGQGYARDLLSHIVDSYEGFAGIQASCRADYAADTIWSKLGFTLRNEVPGRAKSGKTTLRVWWRDLGLPDLFSTASSSRLQAVIDMNVLVDLDSADPTPQHEESEALLADWFRDVVEVVVTDELFQEIHRNPRANERRRRLHTASGFRTIGDPDLEAMESTVQRLEVAIGESRTARERSDRRHLALAALGDADFFVTRDSEILEAADTIEKECGIAVVRPCDLIARTEVELSERSYAPSRLSGSRLTFERVYSSRRLTELADLFLAKRQSEKKGPLLGALRRALSDPGESSIRVAVDESMEPLGLLVTRHTPEALEVLVLRSAMGPLQDVLARHLTWVAVREAVERDAVVTLLRDPYLPESANTVLESLGFGRTPVGVARLNARASSTEELADLLGADMTASQVRQSETDEISNLLRLRGSDLPVSTAAAIEKHFWPTKLLDTQIPSYVVPIRSQWAAELFHEDLAVQSLFGASPALMLRLENAYYRAALPPRPPAPSRVLWYVTASRESPSSRQVVAASMVEEVVTGPAKALFSRFRRYGVFGWEDVVRIANGDPHGELMAFRFGHTEVFHPGVSLDRVRALARDAGMGNLLLQSPFPITSEAFGAIYAEGRKRRG